jgi:transposase
MTTAVDKWPAYARLLAVTPAGHLPTAPTLPGTRPGRSCRTTAALFDVSVASAVKWSQRLRQTGSAAAKPMGGVRRAVLAGERDWLLARINAAPDLTLRALAGELADRGVVVSHWAVWKFCVNEGLSFKKKPSTQRAGSR